MKPRPAGPALHTTAALILVAPAATSALLMRQAEVKPGQKIIDIGAD
jgi:hypothetical protein